jgi:hypothetical protein
VTGETTIRHEETRWLFEGVLSFYGSPTGKYRGFECIQQLAASRYTARGAMLEEDKVISTWALDLTAA